MKENQTSQEVAADLFVDVVSKFAAHLNGPDCHVRLWTTIEGAPFFTGIQETHVIASGESLVDSPDQVASQIEEKSAAGIKSLDLVFPPFIGRFGQDKNWTTSYGRSEYWQVLAERLQGNPNIHSRIAFIVPKASLWIASYAAWRKSFFANKSFIVLEDFHQILADWPGLVSLSLITIKGEGSKRIFMDMEKCIRSADPSCQFEQTMGILLKSKTGTKTAIGLSSRYGVETEDRIIISLFSGDLQERIGKLNSISKSCSLSEAGTILLGCRQKSSHSKGSNSLNLFLVNGKSLSGLQGGLFGISDISADASMLSIEKGESAPSWVLQNGDICIPVIGATGSRLKIATYRGEPGKAAGDKSVIIIRLNNDITETQRLLITEFLGSSFAASIIDDYYSGSLAAYRNITGSDLKKLIVPLADEDLQHAVEGLVSAKEAFLSWSREIDQAISNIFSFSDAINDARLRVLNSGKLARQRFQAASYVGDISYRISNLYPFPIAYLWRYSKVESSSNYGQLRAIIRAAEGHTCFLATIALMISRETKISIAHLKEISLRLSDKRRGTTFGDWFHIVETVITTKAFKRFNGDMPFREIQILADDMEWRQSIMRLMGIRQDDSHLRLSPENVTDELLQSAQECLEQLYRSTDFLTDWKLAFMADVYSDTLSGSSRFIYKDLTGDNQLAGVAEGFSKRTDIERNSLYLRDSAGNWHLARPYLHYLKCHECHQMSTFYLDRLSPKDDHVLIKSFERNSSREEPYLQAFIASGFLV